MKTIENFFTNKRVLITGCCGTVGSELIKILLKEYNPCELIGIDNNESDLFFLDHAYSSYENAQFQIADIRDRDALTEIMREIDLVFHTAAFKHVIFCEKSPYEPVQTNIAGVQNIINSAIQNNVERIIFTSSDKAVNPTSVMGTSKLMGERLITAANYQAKKKKLIFSSTRFGNVLGSRGSVIPIFYEQIKRGGPVSLTDPSMTRFIMSISQAVRLVIESATLAKGGEVFITKMPVIRISDLAEVMIEELAPVFGFMPEDIEIITIGSKPGEKIYEELMSEEETRRSLELPHYFCVLPAFRDIYKTIQYDYENILSTNVTNPYISRDEQPLNKEELKIFLYENNLLQLESDDTQQQHKRYWPGD